MFIYIYTGGIAPKNLERLQSKTFLDAYYDKGRASAFLKQIPIHVVLDENLGQRGAHLVAFNNLVASKKVSLKANIHSPSSDAEYIVSEIKKEITAVKEKSSLSVRDTAQNAVIATCIGLAWFVGMKYLFRVKE